jgi:hypothetical protein
VSEFCRSLVRQLLAWECGLVLILGWFAFISIPIGLGEIGLSWDALNHHIYLGWTAEHQRFDQDLFAASGQTFQYPYLYWPVYKLSETGLSGMWVGVVLATLNWLAVPPVWMIARACITGENVFAFVMRFMAVVLAFMTGVVLSMFDSTSNDLLAAIPFVWALAATLQALCAPELERWRSVTLLVIFSGFCAGVSVAFKLSNGPLVLLLPALWLVTGDRSWSRAINLVAGCLAIATGFSLTYGYWGWQLWMHFGSPIYPFYDSWFEPLRNWLEWKA